MTWLTRLLRRNRVETHLDAELRDHIERQVADHMAAGLSESEARRRANVEFGGLDQVKELCRDVRGTRWLDELAQDIRYGLRVLRRNPSFTFAAVLSLALGIGANTAIFTLVNAIMLKPLPVKEPGRLVELLNRTNPGSRAASNAFSYQALTYYRDHAKTVEVVASHQSRFFVARENSALEVATGQYVTGGYFPILGVTANPGRAITPSDDRAGAPEVAVLSHAYWQRRFGGDRAVIGRPITLNDRIFSIVGIAPAGFRGLRVAGEEVDFWIPLSTEGLMRTPSLMSSASYNWLQIVGRLRDEHDLEAARAELTALYHGAVIEPKLANTSDATTRDRLRRWRPVVESARGGLTLDRQQYGEPLIVLLAISAFVLLIACVNVANLLLARASSRGHEVAIRLSLGARRARVVRQLLTESVLLSLAGAVLGVGIAFAACDYLLGFFATTRTPVTLKVGPDLRVLTFATTMALATGLLFGLAPAWRTTALATPATSLRSGGRSAGGRDRRALSRMLVTAQVALSVILLFCGGLFLRSLHNLRSIDKGFDMSAVLILTSDASRGGLEAGALRAAFREGVARLGAIPGVRSASVSQVTPIWGGGTSSPVLFEPSGTVATPEAEVTINWVSPGYFATLGTPVYMGRDFHWQDTMGSPKVALVNQTLARRYFGDEGAIGKRLTLRGDTFEIVGVVGDVRYFALRESIPPTLYLHWIQQSDALLLGQGVRLSQFAIRTDAEPLRLAAVARDTIREVAPSMAITKLWTLEQQVSASIMCERMLSALSGFFACLGLLLAAIGLYGVMAYTVARRTSEIGIRMALGAEAWQIGGMVVREALLVTAGGIAIGIAAAMLISRALATLLFELTPTDSTTAAAVAAVMIATALMAAYFPSRRAAHINPVQALRTE